MTQSPWPMADAEGATPREAELAAFCGKPDAALHRVARSLAQRKRTALPSASGEAKGDGDVAAMLRRAGEPHLRPRTLVATAHGRIAADVLSAKLAGLSEPRVRCGVGIANEPAGDEVVVAVSVEALADLEPLPSRARTGQWLELVGKLHVPARRVSLVVLGPHGMPRNVPTAFDAETGHVRTRFVLDRPGAFTVQLMGDLDDGPRPLLEARVFADVEPASSDDTTAPGESAGMGGQDDRALERMIAELRLREGLPSIARDPELDRLARAHAAAMERQKLVAHDLGEGDLRVRFEAEGLGATAVGENLVRAASVELAHRALYASPSHRQNLLRRDFTHFGVAALPGADADVYVAEVFATR